MPARLDDETRAVQKLIAEINEIGRRRDRTGRQVIWAFGITFTAALCLLAWVALFAGPPARVVKMDGPRAPAVLKQFRPQP
ncbi:MAG: hypothetical protein KatS3mg005_0421 [Bryobacteraceae bacterium]|jgi:hypothetical protein|nr:MAG: hypothetical protein KatS3mg005_0421 [Bryobacteraceae bacterium]